MIVFQLAGFQVEWMEPDLVMTGAAFGEDGAFADKNVVRHAMGVMIDREETAFFRDIPGLKLDPIQLQGIRPDWLPPLTLHPIAGAGGQLAYGRVVSWIAASPVSCSARWR